MGCSMQLIEYFCSEHLPYGILASIMCLFLPVTTLVLYPFTFFQRFLNLFHVCLHTSMDVATKMEHNQEFVIVDGFPSAYLICYFFILIYIHFQF